MGPGLVASRFIIFINITAGGKLTDDNRCQKWGIDSKKVGCPLMRTLRSRSISVCSMPTISLAGSNEE